MRRAWLLILGLSLLTPSTLAQTAPTDSQTLQALLAELRGLRQDLRTTTIASQRAQILVYRLQAQESVVRRLQERIDDSRSKLAQTQSEEKRLTTRLKHAEESVGHADDPAQEKEIEQLIASLKTGAEAQANIEQEQLAKLTEGEQQLRIERAKLGELEDQLDRLEKGLENISQHSSSSAH
jgi:chromosome segregation ATPase